MNFGFIIDNRKCIGCHACTVACKSEHDVPLGVNRTWVKYIEKGDFPNTQRLFSVMRCNHCEEAPCVEICPTSALFTRKDGIVDFDNNRCIGCKACTQACPYDAIFMDPESLTAAKCNYCTHRVDIGLEPACVNVCPTHAIVSGDMENPNSEISLLLSREKVQSRKPEKGTLPNLFYIEGDELSLNPSATEKASSYMWSQQSSGVGHFSEQDPLAPKTKESFLTTDNLPQKEGEKGVLGQLKSKAQRVYDAPDKGILWGWEVSAYIVTKAIAAGLFLVPFFLKFVHPISAEISIFAGISALIFLGITSVLLVMDLDQPRRFLYVILRPQWRSWLVRGAYILMAYGIYLTLWVAHFFIKETPIPLPFEIVGIILALLAAIYTAFLLAQAKGRDFWQSPLMSFHMLSHSFMAGAGFILICSPFWESLFPLVPFLNSILAGGILFQFFILIIELFTAHPTKDAQKTVKIILEGRFRIMFFGGVLIMGNILPLILMGISTMAIVSAISATLVILGIWLSMQIWVVAPQLIPLS